MIPKPNLIDPADGKCQRPATSEVTMRRMLLGSALSIAFALQAAAPAMAKTARECNADYRADKTAARDRQGKAAFLTACLAAQPAPAGAAAQGSTNGLRKPTAAELAMDRKLKRDMNICIGC